ncbi:hypothetical protein CTM93_20015 [Photobacterium phosphoreum]|nr:hypothetical protein CTM93_20015 [Photobacterium phosphoreum]
MYCYISILSNNKVKWMKANLLNINKIFTDRIFRIPDYQRGYAWTNKQLKDFWNDLRQLESGKNHYVGVLTLEDVSESVYSNWNDDLWIIESKSFSPYYIVDGQQRLTTSILLLQAILEFNKDNRKLNYSTPAEIKKRFIFDSKDDGISRSYIFGYEKDNPSYEFLKTKIFNEKSDFENLDQDTIYTLNLLNAKSFFIERLTKLSFEEVEDIFKKITQNFLFNIYSMSDDIDVYITFETMNNRGKQLSILELLKNRLIFLSTKLKCDTSDSKKLRHSINEAWKSVYHYLGKNKEHVLDDDTFLLNHFFYYFGDKVLSNDEERFGYYHRNLRGLYQSYLLENLFTISNLGIEVYDGAKKPLNLNVDLNVIYKYVQSIKSSVQTWFDILNPRLSDFSLREIRILERIYRLERKAENEMFLILVMVFYEKVTDEEDRVKLLTYIENMLFFSTLVEYRWRLDWDTDDFLRLSIKLASGELNKDQVLNNLHSMWIETLSDQDLMLGIIKNFNSYSRGFYSWDGIRYFLYEYEDHLRKTSKTKREKLNWNSFQEEDDFEVIK